MKKFLPIFLIILSATISLSAEVKVELGPIPEWQKPVMSKVTFGVKMRSLGKILEDSKPKDTPSFLVFTAEAAENLGTRLLWIDAEVEFSNGAVRKFETVSFGLLDKGVEGDVRKLDEGLFLGPLLFGDDPNPHDDSKPVEITKLKILRAVCK